jgi:hypothetical protein
VKQQVVLHEVDVAQIKLKHSDHGIFEKALVIKLDGDLCIFSSLLLDIPWL